MHCYNGISVGQCRAVGGGELSGSGRRGGGVVFVDGVGNLVHPVTQIVTVEQDM